MKLFIALLTGIVIGGGVVWFFAAPGADRRVHTAQHQIETGAKSASDAVHSELQVLDLRSEDIKSELARTGQVVRRTARDAGHALADATADARITTIIKGKLVANRELSALRISVNTTAGVVTLSGTVTSHENIAKAMLVAMETDGVREVVSTLQVKPNG
jgi:hyperosmotically inducible protein